MGSDGGGGRAVWRLAGLLAVLLLLAGCGPRVERIEACRAALALLIDEPAERATRVEESILGGGDGTITLELGDDTDIGTAHRIQCRFAEGLDIADKPVFVDIALDGAEMPPIRLLLLGRALGVAIAPPADASLQRDISPGGAIAFFVQQLINGITLGAILALIALGYSLVYGIIGTIQFAYGGIYAVGAFLGIILIAIIDAAGPIPIVLTLAAVTLFAAAVTGLWGAAIERVVYRPLRDAGPLTPLIAAIGLTLVLENLLRLTEGASYKWLPALPFGRFTVFSAGGFSVLIGGTQLVILAATAILAISLSQLMAHTRLGRAYRACADDRGMAALLGVDVDRVILATFAGGAMLAAFAGLIQILYYGEADPSMGYLIGFKALTAALLGGFGSLPGAVLGGFAIGLIEVFWTAYFGASYKDLVIFVVLCAVLVYRPAGFLGIPEGEPTSQLRGRPLNR